jgi:hypothetical protein
MRAAAIALCAVLAGCDDSADPTIDAGPPREVVMETMALRVGEILEGIMHGGPGDRAVIHLEAPTASLDWNIHCHADGGTQIVDEALKQMTVDYVYTPPASASWWLLLRNSGLTNMNIVVRVELHGEMTWQWE